jgi:PAS domain S-box-containing protein
MEDQNKTKAQLEKGVMELRRVIDGLERLEAERNRAEEELRLSRERLALALDSSFIGMWEYDVRSGTVYYDPRCDIMLGFTPANVTADFAAWMSLIHEEDRDRVIAKITEHLEGKSESYAQEYRMQAASAEWRWLLSSGKVVERDPDGKPIRMIGTRMDITERKRAEEALQESENRYRMIAELASDFIFKIAVEDGKMKTVLMTQEFHRIAGYAPEDLKTTDMDMWTEVVHPDDRQAVLTFFQSMIVSREPDEMEHRIVTKNGEARWLHLFAKPQWDEKNQRLTAIVVVAKDVTGRKQAELRIKELNAELERHVAELEADNKDLENFAHVLSHELKTPLTGVEGFSQLLKERYSKSLDSKGQEYIGIINKNARHMKDLIDDLLGFFKLGRKDMEYSLVDMGKAAQEVYEEMRTAYPDRSIRLELKKIPPAYGDEVMLTQVFSNLMENAVKFSKSQPVTLIEVGGRAEPEANTYYVKDNGIGFPMEQADKIFQAFHRLHSSDEFEGTGTGLAIVQRIAQRHGGKTWAESKPGEGSVFYFSIANKDAG